MGTLAILGNHDYGLHWSQPAVADQVVDVLRGCDVAFCETKRSIWTVCKSWGWMICGPVAAISLAGSPVQRRKRARLVLCHNPDAADGLGWRDYQGWILSGHTHGGQCKPPFLPAPIVSVRNRRYIAGEVDLFDGRRLYINRALGHTLRVRFNVRPEITLFRLVTG